MPIASFGAIAGFGAVLSVKPIAAAAAALITSTLPSTHGKISLATIEFYGDSGGTANKIVISEAGRVHYKLKRPTIRGGGRLSR